MSIWNKILVGLVITASLVFFYTSARTLKTWKYWRDSEKEFAAKLETTQQNVVREKQAIRKARSELSRLLANRGRIWDKCLPGGVVQDAVAVNTDPTAPHHITDKMVLYVFENPEENVKGKYLGEFIVTAVAENKVQLTPAMTFSKSEWDQLTTSKGPWVLYEMMPTDRQDAFAGLSEDEKKSLLPAGSLADYAEDGKNRKLRDYRIIFMYQQMARTLFVDTEAALKRDNQYLQNAVDNLQKQVQLAEQEVAGLKTNLATAVKEQKAVTGHLATLQTKVAAIQEIVARKIQENYVFAAEIAKIQLNAAKRIDERTHTMAQAGVGAD